MNHSIHRRDVTWHRICWKKICIIVFHMLSRKRAKKELILTVHLTSSLKSSLKLEASFESSPSFYKLSCKPNGTITVFLVIYKHVFLGLQREGERENGEEELPGSGGRLQESC